MNLEDGPGRHPRAIGDNRAEAKNKSGANRRLKHSHRNAHARLLLTHANEAAFAALI
ncbi:hypothetical protein U91I_02021 [alpha proteobacterium U9-1i]|nr:hypothetical protein U91I_02021 [alpha proteobacterium U9-1i]